jgi:hypothetical protein
MRLSHRIVEVPVEAQDVRMPQMALDFYLSSQLVLHLRLLKLVLEEHLQGHDVLALQKDHDTSAATSTCLTIHGTF